MIAFWYGWYGSHHLIRLITVCHKCYTRKINCDLGLRRTYMILGVFRSGFNEHGMQAYLTYPHPELVLRTRQMQCVR